MKNFNKVLDLFLSGQVGSTKRDADSVYVATANALIIRSFDRWETVKNYILAVKVGNNILGNSSVLNLDYNRRVLPEQLVMSTKITMIPFSVLQEAKLSFSNFTELDAGPEETLWRKEETEVLESKYEAFKKDALIKVKHKYVMAPSNPTGKKVETIFYVKYLQGQHFAGARLFSVSERVFLLDVDRNELKHGIINPFLVELQDRSVKTISEAYEALKPEAVKQAESENIPVLRQGEWFFIPVQNELERARIKKQRTQILEDAERLETVGTPLAGILQAGQNRPNRVTELITLVDTHFVTGTVEHTGREHAPIKLETWYRAIPNTSQTSWAITGDLD